MIHNKHSFLFWFSIIVSKNALIGKKKKNKEKSTCNPQYFMIRYHLFGLES